MAKQKPMPRKVLVYQCSDGVLLCVETPDDIGEDFDGERVGVYELTHVGKFTVEKQVDAKPVKRR